jgi:hypothetical protein
MIGIAKLDYTEFMIQEDTNPKIEIDINQKIIGSIGDKYKTHENPIIETKIGYG